MGVPVMPTSLSSSAFGSASLPTPAQSPSNQSKNLPTPLADSCGTMFDIDATPLEDAPPAYTSVGLEFALSNPPVQMTIWYGSHILHGSLYFQPSLAFQLYERFFDISPADRPRLADADCKPWVIQHQIQGQTWVDETVLRIEGLGITQKGNQEPRFVAVTDTLQVLLQAQSAEVTRLGSINASGAFQVDEAMLVRNSISVALPCAHALLGQRQAPFVFPNKLMLRPLALPRNDSRPIRITDFPPAPTSSAVLDTVRIILSAAEDDSNIANGTPKKGWLGNNLPEHFIACESPAKRPAPSIKVEPTSPGSPNAALTPQQSRPRIIGSHIGTLSPSSPLWPHRGNEALFKRSIWQQLCYRGNLNDGNVESKGGIKLPDAYSQVLFEDLQMRGRVPGTDELAAVARKWYEQPVTDGSGGEGVAVEGKGKEEHSHVAPAVVEVGEKMEVE